MTRIYDYVQAMSTKANYSGIFTCNLLVLGSIAILICNYQSNVELRSFIFPVSYILDPKYSITSDLQCISSV